MTSACRSSTATGSSSPAAAAIATICWASTSSALRGTTVGSIRPSRMQLRDDRALEQVGAELREDAALADARRRRGPARPMRCSPRATDFGDSTCSTRSTAPMSMPSSSDEVATRHGSSPGLEQLLDRRCAPRAPASRGGRARSRRRGVLGEPGVLQLVEAQREALGAAAVVDEDDRRRVLARRARAAPGRSPARSSGASRRRRGRRARSSLVGGGPGRARPSTRPGTWISQVERLADAGVDDRARARAGRRGSGRPPRAGSASRDRPMRCGVAAVGLQRVEALERQREVRAALGRARPRGSRRRSPPRRRRGSRAPASVSIRYSDSGVVMRMSGGVRRIAARSVCGVSPVRIATRERRRRSRAAARAGCGRRRRRAPSAARRRRGACAARRRARARATSRSRPHRNAASVLPDPVGARDQHVLAGGDRRPRLRLGRRRLREGALEPVADLRE